MSLVVWYLHKVFKGRFFCVIFQLNLLCWNIVLYVVEKEGIQLFLFVIGKLDDSQASSVKNRCLHSGECVWA